jgi:hypothetical protein
MNISHDDLRAAATAARLTPDQVEDLWRALSAQADRARERDHPAPRPSPVVTARPVVEAAVDVARNLLRTRYAGHLTTPDLEAGIAKLRAALVQLQPGFTVLADWSEVEMMELDTVPYIAEIMELARTHGAALIVRVLPESSKDIGINILSATHLRRSARIVTADNLEEAERLIRVP